MKETKKVSSEKKPAYGDYTPSAQKQAHIDELIRKAIGKGVAVETRINIRDFSDITFSNYFNCSA